MQYRNILEMLATAGTDILVKVLQNDITQAKADEICAELEALRKYFNKNMRRLANKKDKKAQILNIDWNLVTDYNHP